MSCNAVPMYALALASQRPATCLDWNNNYGEDPDKCVLFHCGPVPQSLMTAKGQVIDHPMFAQGPWEPGCGMEVAMSGRIAPTPMTFASSKAHRRENCGAILARASLPGTQLADDYFGWPTVCRPDREPPGTCWNMSATRAIATMSALPPDMWHRLFVKHSHK